MLATLALQAKPVFQLTDLGPAPAWSDPSYPAPWEGLGGSQQTVWGQSSDGSVFCGDATRSQDSEQDACLWLSGVCYPLPLLGGNTATAWSCNVGKQVVGEATDSSQSRHAFVWTASSGMTDLGQGVAEYVGDSGQICGVLDMPDGSVGGIVVGGVMADVNSYVLNLQPGWRVVECDSWPGGISGVASSPSGDRLVALRPMAPHPGPSVKP